MQSTRLEVMFMTDGVMTTMADDSCSPNHASTVVYCTSGGFKLVV